MADWTSLLPQANAVKPTTLADYWQPNQGDIAVKAATVANMMDEQKTRQLQRRIQERTLALDEESDDLSKAALGKVHQSPQPGDVITSWGAMAPGDANALFTQFPKAGSAERQKIQAASAAQSAKAADSIRTMLDKLAERFQIAPEEVARATALLGQGGLPALMNDPKWRGVFEQASSTNALQPPQQSSQAPAPATNTLQSIRDRIANGTNFPFVVDQGGAGGRTTAQELAGTPQGQQIAATAPPGTPIVQATPSAAPAGVPRSAPVMRQVETLPQGPTPTIGQQPNASPGVVSTQQPNASPFANSPIVKAQQEIAAAKAIPDPVARYHALQQITVPPGADKILNLPTTLLNAYREATLNKGSEFEKAYGIDPKFRGTPQYIQAFEHYKTLGQSTYGAERIAAMLAQPQSVYDTFTGNFSLKSKEEIVKANREAAKFNLGDRYVGEGAAKFVKPKIAAFNEIETSSQQVKDALKNPGINFSQKQLVKFIKVLQAEDNGSTIGMLLNSDIGKTLTPAERDYITAVKNLKESAFALRGVSGMGQGSDTLRAAIAAVVPGATTPDRDFAISSLNRFDTQVRTLRKGIPGLGSEGTSGEPSGGKDNTKQAKQPPSGYRDSGKTSGGKAVWLSPDGKKAWVAD